MALKNKNSHRLDNYSLDGLIDNQKPKSGINPSINVRDKVILA